MPRTPVSPIPPPVHVLTLVGMLVAGLLVVAPAPVRGQQVEVTPWYGYQYGGSIDVERGELNFRHAPSFGVIVNITVREDAQAEFSYSRQDTELRLKQSPGLPTTAVFDIAVEYYQLGGLLEWPQGERGLLKPFFGLTVGATRFAPSPAGVASEWRFSFAGEGGIKYFFSERLGVRLQGRLLLPYLNSSSSFFCSLPGGCFVSLSGTVMAQGDVGAGLILAF